MAQYAVFGNPAEHSLSPTIHQLFAEQTGHDLRYNKYTIPVDDFEQRVLSFFSQGGGGLNITLPFKQRAFTLADTPSEQASIGKAANTLWMSNEKIVADNTDGIGLMIDIHNRLGWNIHASNLLILGAGGAVRGILPKLLSCQPKRCTIANRTLEKAQELVDIFTPLCTNTQLVAKDYGQLGTHDEIILNATSISLGQEDIPFPKQIISTNSLCYDLTYSLQGDTRFCQWVTELGCQRSSDGLGMLVEQAAESFRLWRGEKPDTQPVLERIRQHR